MHTSIVHTCDISIVCPLLLCPVGAAQYELEKDPSYWDAQARATLDAALKLRPREHQAKNVILFLGDGKVILSLWNLFHQTVQTVLVVVALLKREK